jgi:penicillin-binding protein 1C
VALAAGLLLSLPAAGVLWWRSGLPRFEDVRASCRSSDLILVDRQGRLLHEIRVDPHRRRLQWVPLAEISPILTAAVLEAEDRRFYNHSGVDWRAVSAALWQKLAGGGGRGASTISMQLVGLLDPALTPSSGRRTLLQKLYQLVSASLLDGLWSKEEILEAYLNLVSFRGELQGIQSAARGLFNKEPHGLTVSEAAVLAALIRSPEAPVDQVRARARRLAAGLEPSPMELEIGEAARALEVPYRVQGQANLAPHVARLLAAAHPDISSGVLAASLDRELQSYTLAQVQRRLGELQNRNVRDAAVLAADVRSGEILAYVGNGGESSSARHVDGVRAPRQAGSTLKPFLYATAFDMGLLTPASLIDDSPVNLMVTGGIYRPDNYDHRFRGPVTVRLALGSSLNIPAVQALELLGRDTFLTRLERFGFRSLRSPEYYGPSLALGSADVTLWELVTAYLALARGGDRLELRLEPGSDGAGLRVVSPEAAFLVSDILSDREARSATFSLESPLATAFWTAVKTGTSKDMRDNWCVGYSSRYVVGVWVGNFSGEPMWDVSGVTGAAPIWLDVIGFLHRREPSSPPVPPAGLERVSVQFDGPAKQVEEWFVRGSAPQRVRRVSQAARHRILYPPQGTIVAVDPDIPPARQAVFFEAEPATREAVWELNGRRMGDASGLVAWSPRMGRYRLRLLSLDGKPLDEVEFFVRGPELAPDSRLRENGPGLPAARGIGVR